MFRRVIDASTVRKRLCKSPLNLFNSVSMCSLVKPVVVRSHLAVIVSATLLLSVRSAGAQSPTQAGDDVPVLRHVTGSSAFLLGNFSKPSPSFFQLNYGYRLTRRSLISLEAITWKYQEPLGIPYGPSKFTEAEEYPGEVRSIGVGVAYQQLLWRGLYVAGHALPLHQRYTDRNGAKLGNGFQLFTTLRAGYQVNVRRERWFIEPSIAATAWPINTNVPAAFAALDRKWNRYFLFEPGLHFGIRF